MPRSGTTWIVHSLNLHSRICAFGEVNLFSRNWLEPTADGLLSSDQLDRQAERLSRLTFSSSVSKAEQHHLKGGGWFTGTSRDDIPEVIAEARATLTSDARPVDLLDAIGRTFCTREKKDVWVEKSAVEGRRILKTLDRAPGARFVVTMREPAGFLKSYKYQGAQSGPRRRAYYVNRYHAFLGAMIWRKNYKAITKAVRRCPDRVSVHVLNDDDSRRDALDAVCRFLGVAPEPAMYSLLDRKVNSSQVHAEDERTLDAADLAWIRLLCRAKEPELRIPAGLPRTTPFDLIRSLPSLVSWMFRIRRMKAERVSTA